MAFTVTDKIYTSEIEIFKNLKRNYIKIITPMTYLAILQTLSRLLIYPIRLFWH